MACSSHRIGTVVLVIERLCMCIRVHMYKCTSHGSVLPFAMGGFCSLIQHACVQTFESPMKELLLRTKDMIGEDKDVARASRFIKMHIRIG